MAYGCYILNGASHCSFMIHAQRLYHMQSEKLYICLQIEEFLDSEKGKNTKYKH